MLGRLLIWIVLCALPLQGFAALEMMHCSPLQHAHHHPDPADGLSDTATSVGDHHSSGSDSSYHVHKTTCCAGALALTTTTAALFPPAHSLVVGLYHVGVLPTVFLEGPRRPPRTFLA